MDPTSEKSTKTKIILVTYVVSALYLTGFFLTENAIPFIVKELAIDSVHFGYLLTVFAVAQLVGSPIYGFLCDRLGVRFGLILAMVFAALGHAGVAMAESYHFLLATRLLGIFMLGDQGAQTCLAAFTSPGAERTVAFGRMGITFGVGFIFGPLIGGLLSNFFGSRLSIIFSVLMCLISVVLILAYIPSKNQSVDKPSINEKKKSELRGMLHIVQHPSVAILFIIKNLAAISLFVMMSVFGIYLIETHKLTPAQNSIFSAWIGVCMTLMNAVGIVVLRQKFSDRPLLKIGAIALIFMYTGIFYFGLYGNFYELYLIMPLLPVGMTLINVITDSLLTAAVSESEQGTILGLCYGTGALVRVLAPTVAGYMLQNVGFSSFGVLGIVCALVSLALTPLLGGEKVEMKKME